MRAAEFIKETIIDMKNWKKNKTSFDVSYDDLYRSFIHDWNTGDEWGDIMAALFAIAEELYKRGDGPPNDWEFSPGAGIRTYDNPMSDKEKYDHAVNLQSGEIDDQYYELKNANSPTLIKFGEFLFDLREQAKDKGKDY